MEKESIDKFIKRIKDKAYNIEVRNKQGLTINVNLYENEKPIIGYTGESREILFELNKLIKFHKPDSIEIEFFPENDFMETFTYTLKESTINPQEIPNNYDSNTTVNDGMGFPVPKNSFGPATMEEYVDQKLEESRKTHEIKSLTEKVEILTDMVKTRDKKIEELEEYTDQQEDDIAKLQQQLKKKEDMRYWAEVAGDIVGNLGITKEGIKDVVSGLAGGKEDNPVSKEGETEDRGGIIE